MPEAFSVKGAVLWPFRYYPCPLRESSVVCVDYMKNFKRDGRSGGKKFGGSRAPWKGGGSFGHDQRRELHDATCTSCGADCQVPFRPDGHKPVLCRNCFKKDGAEGRFMRDANSARSSSRFERSERAPQADNSKIEARLNAIESKLDLLIEALTEEEQA